MEGSLSKWTNMVQGWQYRWFVLDDNAGLLSYYTSREKMIRGVRRGCVRLKGAVIGIDDEDDTTFTITVDGKTFHFQARNFEERENWVRCLEDTIVRHAFGCHSSYSSIQYDASKMLPTLNNFDKKVAEADSYLQLLIEQVKVLETRSTTLENEERDVCETIIHDTNTMLEQVKHTIVLLQIAKNSAFPVNGVYREQLDNSSTFGIGEQILSDGSSYIMNSKEDINKMRENDFRPSMFRNMPISSSYITDVPDVSYSTSEDEDFYDAYDENEGSNSVNNDSRHSTKYSSFREGHSGTDRSPTLTPKRSLSVSTSDDNAASGTDENCSSRRESNDNIVSRTNQSSKEVPTMADGSIDFDALYEDPNENELSVESQGSVIKHLISQVKIGMDLTKVALPTFILERRSLLEMYADCFAHPDVFLKADNLGTPKERMVQIVKWYLSSFHAGRKSAVAKKPYNPILGEVFRCWWDVDDEENSPKTNVSTNKEYNGDRESDEESPVPWCNDNQLVFIAEQVSHHPPISAFYAEHPSKQVSLCAHIWTKSKFLGLSIGVHNIGSAVVKLLQHDEEYICTFPNGYGRSILNVPWIELGGPTTIKCTSSGYYANVEFLTKPFYGGKKHRIQAEVFSPNEKKPFLTVTGEWNGHMEAKWTDGQTESFIDTKKVPIIKKRVRKIEEQEENESRKIWKMVTLGLKYNDVDKATNAKIKIEQKQREEAQYRREKNESWQPKYFYEHNGSWLYKNPLEKRLRVKD